MGGVLQGCRSSASTSTVDTGAGLEGKPRPVTTSTKDRRMQREGAERPTMRLRASERQLSVLQARRAVGRARPSIEQAQARRQGSQTGSTASLVRSRPGNEAGRPRGLRRRRAPKAFIRDTACRRTSTASGRDRKGVQAMVENALTQGDDEGERFSELEQNLRALRTIRDTATSNAERINAIKELGRLTGTPDDMSAGPGGMTRAELLAELERCRVLTASMTAQK